MENTEIAARFQNLTTPHVADACLRRGVEVRCAPWNLRPLSPSSCLLAGRVQPARHYGSIDIFLDALERASPGDVLIVDNGGRQDEACVGVVALVRRGSHARLPLDVEDARGDLCLLYTSDAADE